MTISTISLVSLKKAKNSVIGNPLAKIQLVRDEVFVSQLIHSLNVQSPDVPPSPSSKMASNTLRMEAAHVIASLSYGSEEALATLLRGNTHHAFLYAMSHFSPADSPALRAAFSRALRALASSLADFVGPSLWGLRPETSMIRSEAQQALDYLFQIDTLDIYLPLLILPSSTPNLTMSTAVATSTAQMLATTIRTAAHRRAVVEWMPPAERQREVKSRRGWEKTSTLNGNAASPWVTKRLVALLGDKERERDTKLMEAVLSALAALVKETPSVANFLEKPSPEGGPPPLATVLDFTKSRSIDVQLAACLCLTYTLRASALSSHPHSSLHPHLSSPGIAPSSSPTISTFAFAQSSSMTYPALEENCTRTIMNLANRVIAAPLAANLAGASTSTPESPQMKTKACFILHYLVTDDAPLCHAAFDRGCLEHIGDLIRAIAPPEPASAEWEEDEPESISHLREAALTCLASLALCSDDIRRRITDDLRLLPYISRALRAKSHVGTRYAACQCVRAVSRAVSVLRTGIVDSGLGMDVLRIVLGKELGDRFGGSVSSSSSANGGAGRISGSEGKKKERDGFAKDDDHAMDIVDGSGSLTTTEARTLGEDRRVLSAALSAVCNIVNDFSPLRPIYLEEKLMPRLVYILKESGDPSLRLNALWAVKNLVRKTSTETKRDIMSHLGWQELLNLFTDPEEEIKEQGFNILRNLAENEEGIAMVFRELGPQVLGKLVDAMRSSNEDVVLQATFSLANLANGSREQQDLIMKYPQLLAALQICLSESTAAVRRPAVSCVLTLAQANPRRRKEMAEAGIVGTLRRLCEWSGHALGHPHGGHHGHGYSTSISGAGLNITPSNVAVTGGPTAWAGRSPVRSPSASNAAAGVGGVPGSWAGSGSLHHYHSAQAVPHHGHGAIHGTGTTGTAPSHPMVLDDDRDVVQRARNALEWLEHGETYVG